MRSGECRAVRRGRTALTVVKDSRRAGGKEVAGSKMENEKRKQESMKRNQIKMIAAALCVMMVMASRCGKQSEGEEVVDSIGEQSEEPSQEVTFQDQYDLGMRLLSEGSYEEAIIAFQAALEIDPRSVDVYTALADTYEAMGDTEGLRRILEQGIEATGDAGLQERLSQLPPQRPEGLSLGIPEREYVVADEALEALLADMIEAGLAGNREVLEDAAWNAQLAQEMGDFLKEKKSRGERHGCVSENEEEDKVTYRFWTVLSDGALVGYNYVRAGVGLNHTLQYRPVSGDGFGFGRSDYLAIDEQPFYHCELLQGQVEGWFFDGAFVLDTAWFRYGIPQDGDQSKIEHITGIAQNDLLEGTGEEKVHYDHPDGSVSDQSIEIEDFKKKVVNAL